MVMGVVGKGVFGRGYMRGDEGWVSGVMRVCEGMKVGLGHDGGVRACVRERANGIVAVYTLICRR
ncbi:hypothetical protein BSK55_29090 [Paenibacillus odorifer]|nr:hypothetical protein BSK55_29090 [Paenibacillus odorifer]